MPGNLTKEALTFLFLTSQGKHIVPGFFILLLWQVLIMASPCHNKGFNESLEYGDNEGIFEGTAQVKLCRKTVKAL